MYDDGTNGRLHLPDLSIAGFRGIERLSIPRLGRVTLLAGRNGVGKTTVLDAVRVYASCGRSEVLRELLDAREEVATAHDEDDDPVELPNLAALFHGRNVSGTSAISIGPITGDDALGVAVSKPEDWSDEQRRLLGRLPVDTDVQWLKIAFRESESILPWVLPTDGQLPTRLPRHFGTIRMLLDEDEWASAVACESLGPGLLSNYDMARFWDNVVLTDAEELSIQALRLVLRDEVSRVAVIGEGRPRYPGRGRRVVVRLPEAARPVPLRSLGDGVTRMFGVALALANSRGGFLTIDEAENGIHYSLQSDFWRMVLRASSEHDVQVFATTHSGDCVRGFARAAVEVEDVEGVLVRLERKAGKIRAVEYSEEELETAAEQGIEVR